MNKENDKIGFSNAETPVMKCSWECFQWPTSYMKKEFFRKGDVLFRKGDKADKMYYIKKGALKLLEINKIVREGEVIGEMGIFSPHSQRMATAVCEKDMEVYTLSKEEVVELFSKDPTVATDLMHLSCQRFTENLRRETEAKERIKSELRIAAQIQLSMLPRKFPPFPERREFDIFATMVPAKEVGGDLYDFFFIDENRLCFLIGDVSGKGVPAALFMAITKTLLRTEAKHGLSPEEVLSRVNDTLVPDNDACMFVTIFCAVLDVRTGKVEFSNGGHNPPLVLRAGTFEYMQVPKGFVVGAMEGIKFTKGEYTLDPGDVIFLYTDGVTEAMNPEDELFSERRLKEYFSKLTDRSVEEIVEGVKDEIKLFVRDREQSDDITMLALKFRGKRR